MDNSISDENITTVTAALIVEASTKTADAETSTITNTPEDNSQCVNNNDDNDQESVNSDNNVSINRYDKISSVTSIYPNQVNLTTDQTIPFTDGQMNCHSNISRTKDLVHKCQSDPGGRSSMRSQINRSLRHPACGASNVTTTTRKCVLTLDGYNYVIVASSPDNKSKSENTAGPITAEQESNVNCPADDRSVDNLQRNQSSSLSLAQQQQQQQHAVTPPLNGLISIRRSSSKKVNLLPKQHSHPQIDTGFKFAYQQHHHHSQTKTQNFDFVAQNTPKADNIEFGFNTDTVITEDEHIDRKQDSLKYCCCCTTFDTNDQLTPIDRCTFASDDYFWDKMQSDSVTSTSTAPHCTAENDGNESNANAISSSNQIDLTIENLPAVDTPDACDKAATRLRCLLKLLPRGDVPLEILQKNLHYAARVLEALYIDETKRLADEDDELSEVQPDAVPPEVREWLASTFTRQLVTTRKRTEEKPKFRTVAHAIRAGIFVDRIYRRVSSTAMLQFPPDVVKVLKTLDDWSFDQFALATATNGQPIKYLGYDLLNRYGIIHKFKVAPSVLEQFLIKIEEGYCRYQNPYHNNLHAADVAQTIHYMLCQTGIMHYLTDLEIFAILIAALIHDYEHTGTTNSFHINTGSDMAMLYNDRAVLENHHASAAFRMLKEDEYNIFSNLSREEYKEIRNLVIDMVISTDMSFHNQQLKNMKSLIAIASSDTHYNKTNVDLKFKALSFILHCCDISHPAKKWEIHHRWTMLLIEEFFRQGDLERELGLDISPLCDRNSTVIPKSQIVFIEVIVEPSLAVCADLLELILTPIQSQNTTTSTSTIKSNPNNTIDEESKTVNESTPTSMSTTIAQNPPQRIVIKKPWIACMKENKRIWKEQEIAESSSQTSASTGESSASETNAERPSTS